MASLQIQRALTRKAQRFCVRRSSTIASSVEVEDIRTTEEPSSGPAKPFSDMPGPEGIYDVPYLGFGLHFKPFGKYSMLELDKVFKSLRDKYGDIHKIRIGAQQIVLIDHPDYAEKVYRLPAKAHKRATSALLDVLCQRTSIMKPLSLLNGKEWATRRKLIQDKLTKPKLVANYISPLDSVADDFIQKLRRQQVSADLYTDLLRHSFESIGMLTINKRFGALEDNYDMKLFTEFERVFTIFHESFLMPIETYRYFRTKQYKEFERNFLALYYFFMKNAEESITHFQRLEKEGVLNTHLEKEPNLLYSMLSDERIPLEEATSTILDLYSGAIDSTANGITFTLCDLALHTDKQATAFEEVKRVLGRSSQITKDHINKMSYLRCCIKESQRIRYPVFLGAVRFLERDASIGGYDIPKGTQVIINNELMCSDERFFPRPTEYLPERWLRDERSGGIKGCENHPFILKPFGFGARACPGQRIAEILTAVSIAKIIQNFEVSLPMNTKEIKWRRRIFATPVDKVNMSLKQRQYD